MIRTTADEIALRAEGFTANLRLALANANASASANANVAIETLPGFSVIGGGSTPDQQLPTQLISISSPQFSPATLESRLRKPASGPPVIARIEDDHLILDLRTVFPDEEPTLAAAIVTACQ
jgi:L-seryl-tRNA(Ser) seleniumtransferase